MAPKSVQAIINDAKASVVTSNNNVDNLYVMIGTIPGDTPTMLGFSRGRVSLQADSVDGARTRGNKIFKKFSKYLKEAVCEDFGYCAKRDVVKQNLEKFLPAIVKAILKKIPISGKLPGWLSSILSLFGIAVGSTEVLVTMFVAWILIEGCDKLCSC